jgi:hypothetical protein
MLASINHALQVDLEKFGFDRLASGKVLRPDDIPIRGWAFFELTEGNCLEFMTKLRITIYTTSGVRLSTEIPLGPGTLGLLLPDIGYLDTERDLSAIRKFRRICSYRP